MILFLSCLTAFVASLLLTPYMRSMAVPIGLVDVPDGRRKLHRAPIPLGGGLAVGLAVVLAVATVLTVVPANETPESTMFLNGLLLAVIAIVGVGFLDDRFTLRGRQKLAGQVAAAGILIASGLRVEQIHVFGTQIDLGLLGIPFTLFWLLGAINSLNLIDGIDGLASSVGVILSMSIAGMAWMTGHDTEAIIALALCGALLGFLVYNFPPASIYLGDAGSMLIGLLLGALAIRSSLKGPATVALAAPTVMWTIPILDVGMAILRRKLTGRSIYHTDRGHLHHCLLRQGFSNRTTLFWIGLLCVFTAFGSLASVASQNEWLAISSAVMVFAVLLITRWFGNVEVALLGCRIRSLVLSVFHVPQAGSAAFRVPVHTRFTGTRDWEDLWNTLTEYAERFDLCSVQLNVQLPAWNEDYHVNWVRRDQVDDQHEWSTELPLISNDLTVGRLQIRGRCNHGSVCTWMGELIAGLKPFEAHLLSLLEDQLVQAPQEQFEDSIREPVPA